MKYYRVFFQIPAYRSVDVEANSVEEARRLAEKTEDDESQYKPDWDADEEYAFTIEL